MASLGNVPAYREIEEHTEIRAGRGTLVGRVAMECGTVQSPDAWNDPDYEDKVAARVGQARSMLGVPLLRDGEIGTFALARMDPVPFTDREVELVTTFADQAVIAIENVRLFDEVQALTAALARSVAELQALEEVLRTVNSSLDLETVLATIISRAVQLSQADEGSIYEFDETQEVFVPKAAFGMSSERVEALRDRRLRLGETHLGRAAVLRAPVRRGRRLVTCSAAAARGRGGRRTGDPPTRRWRFWADNPHLVTNLRRAVRARHRERATVPRGALRAYRGRSGAGGPSPRKMASLGQLTADIAHENRNPLNFVNNFSDLSIDLLDELHGAVAPNKLAIAADLRTEIDDPTPTSKATWRRSPSTAGAPTASSRICSCIPAPGPANTVRSI